MFSRSSTQLFQEDPTFKIFYQRSISIPRKNTKFALLNETHITFRNFFSNISWEFSQKLLIFFLSAPVVEGSYGFFAMVILTSQEVFFTSTGRLVQIHIGIYSGISKKCFWLPSEVSFNIRWEFYPELFQKLI